MRSETKKGKKMNIKKITKKVFNDHMKDKVREEWRNFSKWKKSFPTCVAYFNSGKLFHIGEPKKGEKR